MPVSKETEDKIDSAVESAKDAAKKTADNAKEFASDVKAEAEDAFESGKDAASKAFKEAKAGIRAVEREISPAIDDFANKAQALASKSIDFCAESSDRARKQFQHATEATTKYVIDQPVKSVLLAAAAGAFVASAFLLGSRKK